MFYACHWNSLELIKKETESNLHNSNIKNGYDFQSVSKTPNKTKYSLMDENPCFLFKLTYFEELRKLNSLNVLRTIKNYKELRKFLHVNSVYES